MALNGDNNFLQSDIWRKFQKAVGHKTLVIREGDFSASIIEHQLPVVGKYFYIPRWPLAKQFFPPAGGFNELIELAKKEKAGWIRIEPENEEVLNLIKKNIGLKIQKSPHDMQPKEIFVIDITKSEDELLAGMKSKTRYNIKLAEKHGVKVFSISNSPNYLISNQIPNLKSQIPNKSKNPNDKNFEKYVEEFIRLVRLTEKRKDIKFHSADYYRKMLKVIPSDILKLYVAEYENKIIAANLVVFYRDTATYLHGATDDEYRNVMAPYFLQWQAIKDAKILGYKFYDFGGIKATGNNSWSGITKFKLGFSPATSLLKFPGSFDLIINTPKYFVYFLSSYLKNYL